MTNSRRTIRAGSGEWRTVSQGADSSLTSLGKLSLKFGDLTYRRDSRKLESGLLRRLKQEEKGTLFPWGVLKSQTGH
ncbi:MAG: hypothetical protein KDA80_04200 [Planctomycetaceae bacterium]|nr:hypothetical protein [Planctomycetaceae bacterium]